MVPGLVDMTKSVLTDSSKEPSDHEAQHPKKAWKQVESDIEIVVEGDEVLEFNAWI